MPRRARIVFAGVPHHITQRGNHRQRVFFSPGDQETYLALLRDYGTRWGLDVIAYCLMPNHVHHVAIPSTPRTLEHVFKSVHGRYAQRVNRMRGQSGHLWQGRFFSSPLDGSYFLNAVRYVEQNPVRAFLVRRPEEFAWSSAPAHCGLRNDLVVRRDGLIPSLAAIPDWSKWLQQGLPSDVLKTLRQNSGQNLPCGSDDFVADLEAKSKRDLRPRGHGGARKPKG